MDLSKLIGANPAALNVLPPELHAFINAMLEGRIKSFVIVAEETDDTLADQIVLDLNGGRSNVYALIGGIEGLKRDLLRLAVESRVNYAELEDENDD